MQSTISVGGGIQEVDQQNTLFKLSSPSSQSIKHQGLRGIALPELENLKINHPKSRN